MSGAGFNPLPDPGHYGCDDDLGGMSLQWPQDGPESSEFLGDVEAWDEVVNIVNALARHAWFTPLFMRDNAGLLTRSGWHDLSPGAREHARGMWLARIQPNPYLWTHAFVCLDCFWVGSFDVEGRDVLLQRDLHSCAMAERR